MALPLRNLNDGVYLSEDGSSVEVYSPIAYLLDSGVCNQRFAVSYTPSSAIALGIEMIAASASLIPPPELRDLAEILTHGARLLDEKSATAGDALGADDQLSMWCRRGHPMTDDNTRPGRSGEPMCQQCLREHLAAIRQWRQRREDAG